MKELRDRLRYAAKLRNQTYDDIAQAVGVSQPAVAQWASGAKKPNRDNIRAAAAALEVPAEWLETGEGEAPGRLDSELRTEYRDATAGVDWIFRPAPIDGRDYGNPNIWSFQPKVDVFVREVLQNSLDAQSGPEVDVAFRLVVLRGDDRRDFLDAIRWEDRLRVHIESAASGTHKLALILDEGLKHLADPELLLLCVDDSGTTGLIGGEHGPGGHFAALTRNNLDSQKASAKAGGAFGLGKAVLWRSSRIATVLFNSNLSIPEDGRSTNRIFGKVELGYHRAEADGEDREYAGPGWFGRADQEVNGARAISFWENEALAKDLHLSREPRQSGTSLCVVGFHDPSGENETVDQLADAIADAAARWFWPAMVQRRLTVRVEVRQGYEVIRKTAVEADAAQPAYASLLQDHVADKIDDLLNGGPGETVRRDVTLHVPRRTANVKHPEFEHAAKLLVRRADPDDVEDAYQIAFFRGPGMVVWYENVKALTAGAPPFHAAVLCGDAAGIEPEDGLADQFLRTAEPPAHNRWTLTQELGVEYQRGGGKAIGDFIRDAKLLVAELVAPPEEDLDDGPRWLKDLLRLSGEVPPPPPRPRVLRPQAKPTGDAWEVTASIFVKAGDTGWKGRPVVVFNAETGAGSEVKWARLEAVKDCVIDGDWLTVPKGKREVTFTGLTDAASHPVPIEDSSIVIDFRDVDAIGGEA